MDKDELSQHLKNIINSELEDIGSFIIDSENSEIRDRLQNEVGDFIKSVFLEGGFNSDYRIPKAKIVTEDCEVDSSKLSITLQLDSRSFIGRTAFELRSIGVKVEDKIPDLAVMTSEGWEWIDLTFTVGEDESASACT